MFPTAILQPGPGAASVGGGVSIGDAIGSGTVGRGLFVDTGVVLGQSAAFTFDKATGTLAATLLKASGLTAGRVPFSGVAGLLGDSAAFTFAAGVLSVTSMVLGGKITSLTQGTSSGEALHAGRTVGTGTGATTGLAGGGALTGDLSLTVSQDFAPTWTGDHTWSTTDAGTTSVTTHRIDQHLSSGAPAAGFGVGWLAKLHSSTNVLRTAGELDIVWSIATNAAEVSALVLKTMQAGTLTETARFGGIAPAVDFQVGFGRVLLDSRTTDQATFSHRSRTETTGYAIRQTSAGATTVNALAGVSLILANANNTKMTVDSTGISFFAGATVTKQTGPVSNITNSVTSGGTDSTIANYTDLAVYANDSAAIRNDIYQLARSVKFCSDALRAYGLLT